MSAIEQAAAAVRAATDAHLKAQNATRSVAKLYRATQEAESYACDAVSEAKDALLRASGATYYDRAQDAYVRDGKPVEPL